MLNISLNYKMIIITSKGHKQQNELNLFIKKKMN